MCRHSTRALYCATTLLSLVCLLWVATPRVALAHESKAAAASKTAASKSLPARDSARLPGKGRWTIGIFNPLEYGITDTLSVETHPLLLVASPNFTLRHAAHTIAGWRVTREYSLSLPRIAMTQPLPLGLAGYFFPSCKVSNADATQSANCDQAGWILVPTVGGKVSRGERHIWTLRAEISVGLPLGGDLGRPLEQIPPADLLFAAATYGMRTRLGVRYDRALSDTMRLSGELNLYVVGQTEEPSRNPFTATAHVGFDVAVGAHSRFTIGVLYMNSDQRRKVVEQVDGRPQRVSVRNHDVYPTIDFIWGG